MSLPHLFNQAQLEAAVGGPDRLVRMARCTGPSDPNYAAFIASVQNIADGTAYSHAQVYAAVTDTTTQTSPVLSEMALAVGVWWAHYKGTGGQEIPMGVAEGLRIATAWFESLKNGGATLGTELTPSTSAGLTQVDIDPDSVRMTRANLNGAGFA